MASLEEAQLWLQCAITKPWDDQQAFPDTMIREDCGLDAASRLGIYSRAYQGRLIECMESEYPVLQHAMGDDLFVRFASEYLIAHPPHSYSLTELGKLFPRYLAQTRPAAETKSPWADFLIELALLERLFNEVFRAVGTEELDSFPSADTKSIVSEPGVQFMVSRFPLDDYFIATRSYLADSGNIPATEFPSEQEIALLIFRRDYVVRLRRILRSEIPDS